MNRPQTARLGWNWCGDSWGFRVFDTGDDTWAIQFENGAVGAPGAQAGEINLDWILIEADQDLNMMPRYAHASNPHQLRIGNGGEIFPIRACKVVRFTTNNKTWKDCFDKPPQVTRHDFLALPESLAHQKQYYDDRAEGIFECLRTGQTSPILGLYNLCQMWMPMGLPDKGEVGGTGIEFYPGWERSSKYRLISHDLTMERHGVAYVNYATGEPIIDHRWPQYDADRGHTENTQLREFTKPLTNSQYEYYYVPKQVNPAPCSYRATLVGYSFVNPHTNEHEWATGYLPRDPAHAVRTSSHLIACAFLYGDPVAKHNLKQVAADYWMGCRLVEDSEPGKPDSNVTRMLAETFWTIMAADRLNPWYWRWWRAIFGGDPASRITRVLRRVQHTFLGTYQEFTDDTIGAPSPSPYSLGHLGLPSLPLHYKVMHTLEVSYLATAMAQRGEKDSSELAARKIGPVSLQWKGWVNDSDTSYRMEVGNVESFMLWPMVGALASKNKRWNAFMQSMIAPGQPDKCGTNPKQALLNAGYYEITAKALEALEQ